MERTPKLRRRKNSLTLGRLKKRQASPESQIRSYNAKSAEVNKETPHSPSLVSVSFDNGIEADKWSCTPPQKKYNLDDSLDNSPRPFDTSFSPGSLLSQTMTVDSPEVSWRWGHARTVRGGTMSTATPDSSYVSAGSSSTESTAAGTRADINRQRLLYDLRREERRRALDLELRRAEKARSDELLKQRCAKVQEQMKDAEKQRQQEKENIVQGVSKKNKLNIDFDKVEKTVSAICTKNVPTPKKVPQISTTTDVFDDFFNDSESDGFLLEATQQLESKIIELTQKTTAEPASTSMITTTVTTKSSSPTKEKRSSLFMKFLEDDAPDDWFLSLDDGGQQVEQAKKPRTSLQRYNSMPANGMTTKRTATGNLSNTAQTTTSLMATSTSSSNMSASGTSKFKRHASTYSLNPSSSSCK